MSHPLDGIWEKIKRSDEHIKNLNDEITNFLNDNVYRIVCESNANAREHILRIVGPDPPLRFSILAGEIIHHCRSALDHLIWQLVIANGETPTRRNEFPICQTPEKFKEACDRGKIKGVSPSATALIKKLQPYHNPKGFQWHNLWVLHDMDVTDKHKLILTVVGNASVKEISIDTGTKEDTEITIQYFKWPARARKDGTELFRLTTPPRPNMKVDSKPAVQIAFENYGPSPEVPIIYGVNELRNGSVLAINDFLQEFT